MCSQENKALGMVSFRETFRVSEVQARIYLKT